jgi:hypothetical protein
MPTKYSGLSWIDTSDPLLTRWIPRLGALVVLGAPLVTLPTSLLEDGAMKAVGVDQR